MNHSPVKKGKYYTFMKRASQFLFILAGRELSALVSTMSIYTFDYIM